MQSNNKKYIKLFILRVLIINIVIIFVAIVLARFLNFSFGFLFFLSGLLTTAIGLYLNGPKRYHEDIFTEVSNHPVRAYSKWLFHYLRTKAPKHGFENVLFYSGLLTLILSLPFICQIMYG